MDERQMTAKEYIESKLPSCHYAAREIKVLTHCRSHPFKWAMWDFKRRLLPYIKWQSPMQADKD